MIKMLKNSPVPPVFTSFAMTRCPSAVKTVIKLERLLGHDGSKWPEIIKSVKESGEEEVALEAFGLALVFLEDCLMIEQVVTTGTY